MQPVHLLHPRARLVHSRELQNVFQAFHLSTEFRPSKAEFEKSGGRFWKSPGSETQKNVYFLALLMLRYTVQCTMYIETVSSRITNCSFNLQLVRQ